MPFASTTVSSEGLSPEVTQALLQAHRTRRPVRVGGVCYWVRERRSTYDTAASTLVHVFTLRGAPNGDCG
jgi:hypothetical protein